jgi:transposase
LELLECQKHNINFNEINFKKKLAEYWDMSLNEERQKYPEWERKVFEFIAAYKHENPVSPIKCPDGTELHIRYLYSSPEVTSVGISYGDNSRDPAMIFIKIRDEPYAIYPHQFAAPSKVFKYVLELMECQTRQEKSWKITDEFWAAAEPLIPQKERDSNKVYQRKSGGGRPPMEPRKVLEAVFYVLRTGIQWNALPKTFGASSSVHHYFRFWREKGFFPALRSAGLEKYDEVKGINWAWLDGDGRMTKAPSEQETAPTGKKERRHTPYARRRCR